jgi:FkbM family methyltransferase
MTSEIGSVDDRLVASAVAMAGADARLRETVLEALREAEARAGDGPAFREHVRWPLTLALLAGSGSQRIVLENGLIFDVRPESRIEQALLLSPVAHPDHVWEPQTTRLLATLAAGVAHAIVGGAYIGDHVLPLARMLGRRVPPGQVHAFEPMAQAVGRLVHNLALNDLGNVVVERAALWDRSGAPLRVVGPLALASSQPTEGGCAGPGELVASLTIDDYVESRQLSSVGLVMLDIEGAEERALRGAFTLLDRPYPHAPDVVFEVHRHFVDWTGGLDKTSVVRLLTSRGYRVFAIRDVHGNCPMGGRPIEVVPVGTVHLDGPPHGFNVLASKAPDLIERLGLRVVEHVSPKLIRDKDPRLHHPVGGW